MYKTNVSYYLNFSLRRVCKVKKENVSYYLAESEIWPKSLEIIKAKFTRQVQLKNVSRIFH